MKVWFDTEFIEDGKTIELLSIGMVREDGATLYLENADADLSRASDWVRQNVFPHLQMAQTDRLNQVCFSRIQIATKVAAFVGNAPEFWGYYSAYDWVVLCQLYGTMMDLPKGWPMVCLDIKQACVAIGDPRLPEPGKDAHNALADAEWNRFAYDIVMSRSQPRAEAYPPDWQRVSVMISPNGSNVHHVEGDMTAWGKLQHRIYGEPKSTGAAMPI